MKGFRIGNLSITVPQLFRGEWELEFRFPDWQPQLQMKVGWGYFEVPGLDSFIQGLF